MSVKQDNPEPGYKNGKRVILIFQVDDDADTLSCDSLPFGKTTRGLVEFLKRDWIQCSNPGQEDPVCGDGGFCCPNSLLGYPLCHDKLDLKKYKNVNWLN